MHTHTHTQIISAPLVTEPQQAGFMDAHCPSIDTPQHHDHTSQSHSVPIVQTIPHRHISITHTHTHTHPPTHDSSLLPNRPLFKHLLHLVWSSLLDCCFLGCLVWCPGS